MRQTIWDDFKLYVLNSGNVLNKLLIINIAVFVLTGIINVTERLFDLPGAVSAFISYYFSLSSRPVLLLYHPWTLISYQFMHAGLGHIFFNMLVLLFAGRIFREFLGDKKLLSVYILGGIAGGLMYVLAWNIFPFFKGFSLLVGASASILAVLTAAATLVPNYTVSLILIGPIRLVYIVVVLLLIYVLSLAGGNGGGEFAHLGGALWGYIYIKSLQNGTDLGKWFSTLLEKIQSIFKPKPSVRIRHYNENNKIQERADKRTRVSQEEVDAILEKINKSGYDSLSQHEKDTLFRASKE
jgi:membrane associated rhomboid family serine protease